MRTPTYDDLATHYTRLHRLEHLASIAWWDQAANMPPKGNEARAAAMAEMAALLHRMRTDPQLRDLLGRGTNEKAAMVFPVGYPAADAKVPDLRRLRAEEFVQWNAPPPAQPN